MTPRIESLIEGADARPLTVGMRAVFDGRWHYIDYSDKRRQLFDLSKDPAERDDLSAREPAEVARLAALLDAAR